MNSHTSTTTAVVSGLFATSVKLMSVGAKSNPATYAIGVGFSVAAFTYATVDRKDVVDAWNWVSSFWEEKNPITIPKEDNTEVEFSFTNAYAFR